MRDAEDVGAVLCLGNDKEIRRGGVMDVQRSSLSIHNCGLAGTGTEAQPWFRNFNPISQGKRFDADDDSVREYVPELKHVP